MSEMINLNDYSIVLLSAGVGQRLGPLGGKKPKCLLKINNQTLIELLINNLKKRNAKKISIIVGYKSQMLINFLKKIKKIKINFIKIRGYKKNGHSYSWFLYKNYWLKEKKPMILFHTDIHFDPIFLDNILISKKSDIIGVKCKEYHTLKKRRYFVEVNNKNKIKKINSIDKINRPQQEVIGINKFSAKTTKNIFDFMGKFFNKNNKFLQWETLIDHYIRKTNDSIFILKKQNYSHVNINTIDDYYKAKILKFN